jgi:crotonobetainyl-CoA:carnitine CoA-transferase CaiB-like acyl-CoA transferase
MHSVETRPLEGLLVLEFSHVVAGPFTGLKLLQLGARVIKVEPPARGDYLQALAHGRRSYEAMNAGKDIRRIDLASREGRDETLALATQCDVLLDSFRPGVLDRHGLAYETLAAVNPGLVHCSISGWGSQQDRWSSLGAYDHVMQALTGISLQTGNPGDPPIKVGFPLVDTGVGLLAVNAILSALMSRARSGRGQYLEIAMWQAALQLMYPMACELLTTNVESPRVGNGGYTGSPGAGFFACADGWLALGANTPAQLDRAAMALGIAAPDWRAETAVLPSPQTVFADQVAATLRTMSSEAAEAAMRAHDVPVARAHSLRQFLEHAEAVGLLQAETTGITEAVRAPGRGWRSFEPGSTSP